MLRFKGEDKSERRRRHRDQDKGSRDERSYENNEGSEHKASRYRSRSRSGSRSRSRERRRRDSRDRLESRKDRLRERYPDEHRTRGYDNNTRRDKTKDSVNRDRSRSPRRKDPFDNQEKTNSADQEPSKEEKKKKKEKKHKIAPTAEPMIIVTVNDRLGTKASIPCLASDPIKAFKALVAAQIGREPHEIMLKRQGERPFKDNLTLEDYGVSNGVQIDLEVDTGD